MRHIRNLPLKHEGNLSMKDKEIEIKKSFFLTIVNFMTKNNDIYIIEYQVHNETCKYNN